MSVASMLAELRAQRDRLDSAITALEALNGAAPAVRARRPRRAAGRVTIAVAAEAALSKADGPVRTRDLVDLVRAEGASVRDGEGLTKTLNRHPQFRKAGRGLWTLAG